MATTNPYDRRERGLRVGRARRDAKADDLAEVDLGGWASMPATDLLDDGRRAYPGFGLASLEALLRDEYARGYNCGEGTMERRMEEEFLPRRQRAAWNEGHLAGAADGRQEMRSAYERLCGEIVHDLHKRALEVVDASQDPKAAKGLTRAALIDFALAVAKGTDRMVTAHGGPLARISVGEPEEIPF